MVSGPPFVAADPVAVIGPRQPDPPFQPDGCRPIAGAVLNEDISKGEISAAQGGAAEFGTQVADLGPTPTLASLKACARPRTRSATHACTPTTTMFSRAMGRRPDRSRRADGGS